MNFELMSALYAQLLLGYMSPNIFGDRTTRVILAISMHKKSASETSTLIQNSPFTIHNF